MLWYISIYSCVPGVFGNQQTNYLDLIKQMLQLSVNNASNYEVSLIKKFKTIVFCLEIIRKCNSRLLQLVTNLHKLTAF